MSGARSWKLDFPPAPLFAPAFHTRNQKAEQNQGLTYSQANLVRPLSKSRTASVSSLAWHEWWSNFFLQLKEKMVFKTTWLVLKHTILSTWVIWLKQLSPVCWTVAWAHSLLVRGCKVCRTTSIKRGQTLPGGCWALQKSAKGKQLSPCNSGFNNGAF